MRTMRSKFEATPAASIIASGPRASTTVARDCARVWAPVTIASANATSSAPYGTPLSISLSASASTSAGSPVSSLLARSSQAWALVQ